MNRILTATASFTILAGLASFATLARSQTSTPAICTSQTSGQPESGGTMQGGSEMHQSTMGSTMHQGGSMGGNMSGSNMSGSNMSGSNMSGSNMTGNMSSTIPMHSSNSQIGTSSATTGSDGSIVTQNAAQAQQRASCTR
jgi:hypothetical protein